nr:histone-like nucleoid-structuring protein Lsr2 [Nocardioides flavescens]
MEPPSSESMAGVLPSSMRGQRLRSALAAFRGTGLRSGCDEDLACTARSQSGPSAKELREWARENKLEVSERGRIPASVREAYDAAH